MSVAERNGPPVTADLALALTAICASDDSRHENCRRPRGIRTRRIAAIPLLAVRGHRPPRSVRPGGDPQSSPGGVAGGAPLPSDETASRRSVRGERASDGTRLACNRERPGTAPRGRSSQPSGRTFRDTRTPAEPTPRTVGGTPSVRHDEHGVHDRQREERHFDRGPVGHDGQIRAPRCRTPVTACRETETIDAARHPDSLGAEDRTSHRGVGRRSIGEVARFMAARRDR